MPGKKQTARRKKVAEGVVRGQSATSIASDVGASRQTVHRDLAALETKQVIAELTAKYHAEMEKLFEGAVAVITEAFAARKTALSKLATRPLDPTSEESPRVEMVVDLGPDHYARLAAAKRTIELMVAGKPMPKAPDPPAEEKPVTLEQMQSLLQHHAQNHPISSTTHRRKQ